MFKKLIFSLAVFFLGTATFAQYTPKWHETFGGSGDQIAQSLLEVSDGNFLFVGSSDYQKKDVTQTKLLITKFDIEGNEIWTTPIGKSKNQFGNSVIEMENGDFIVTGKSNYLSAGSHDLFIVRVNSEGEKLWDHKFGGSEYDLGNCIVRTKDKGFIISGATESKGNGFSDMWVLKFDEWGGLIWDKTYGGEGFDEANSIIEARNGDFIVTGFTNSGESKKFDINILRLDKFGKQIWNNTFGGEYNDIGFQAIETQSGDIVIAGNSSTTGDKIMSEATIIKTNASGDFLWENRIGNGKRSKALSVVEMGNRELAIAGFSVSKTTGYDMQVTNLSEDGYTMWQEIYGGSRWDEANTVIKTRDNNLLIAGYTKSHNANESDVWTLMLESDITPDFAEYAEITPVEQIFCDADRNIPYTSVNGQNTLAVIIGLEKHKYAPEARYATHDANIFHQYAKSAFGIPDRNILLITNEAATSAEFKKAFMENGWLARRSNKDTKILIYYAGHVLPDMDPDKEEAYLIPYDVDARYAQMLGFGLNELITNLGKLEINSTTIFLDACFTSVASDLAMRALVNKRIAYNANVSLLFASDKDEVAMPYPEKNHGLFTYFLLKGLSGEASGDDNKVSIGELHNYIRRHVSHESGYLDGDQNPQLIAVDKKMILLDLDGD